MKPGDIICWTDKKYGRHRFWRVESVILGTENSESLVRIASLSERPGCDEDGARQQTLLVPEVLLRGLVYQPEPWAA